MSPTSVVRADNGSPRNDARVTSQRLALRPEESAVALGVSRDFFDEYVKPELRVVRRGRLVLVPVVELERWLRENAELTVGESWLG